MREAAASQRLKLIIKPDKNVYDGMNQALEQCQGEYVLFLNCGDRFQDDKVLERTAKIIDAEMDSEAVFMTEDCFRRRSMISI